MKHFIIDIQVGQEKKSSMKTVKHNNVLWAFALVLALFLSSCGSRQFFGSTLTPTSTNTLTPTYALIPTLASTPTPSATPEPILISEYQIKAQSLILETTPYNSGNAEGVLVLQGEDEIGYLLDLQNMTKSELPIELKGHWKLFNPRDPPNVVSPNRKWLAYAEASDDLSQSQLRVVTSDGEPLPISDRIGWFHVMGWLDDQRLALTREGYFCDGIEFVFNPFTGEKQTLTPTYPITTTENRVFEYPYVFYDPTLTRAAYFWLWGRSEEKCVLWNAISGNILWEKITWLCYQSAWSPDGNCLAISYSSYSKKIGEQPGLSVVDINGKEVQFLDVVSGYIAWSPDGHKIAALWAGAQLCSPEIDGGLAVVDLTAKEITLYCIELYGPAGPPRWSPDGQWIAISKGIEEIAPGELEPGVFIIDLIQNKVFEVSEGRGSWVIGWMTAMP
jgi:hypothetical protein